MKHELQRKYSGINEMFTIWPTCSCGWQGTGHAAYEDYQYTLVKEQEGEHLRQVHRQSLATPAPAVTPPSPAADGEVK